MSNKIKFFFTETNVSPETSKHVLWVTLKAYLRGQMISYGSNSKKESTTKLKELSDGIAEVETQYDTSPTPELYQKIFSLQTEFDWASTAKAEQLILPFGLNGDNGDKSSKLLAHQACQSFVSRQIMQIKTSSGSIVSDHVQINSAFSEFYTKLFTSEC